MTLRRQFSHRASNVAAAAISLALAFAFCSTGQPPLFAQQGNCRTFPETARTVCGKFIDYWQAHGGLPQQGFPLSGEFPERSDVNGKVYTVQYFERALFEMHPENNAPYDVLLSLLGTLTYRQKYPNGAPEMPAPANPQPGLLFPQTGKEIRGDFLTYWQQHGGLAQQGYPITNLVREKDDLDGREYTVQYFERAIFEAHPENQPPYNILLAQLGTARAKQKYPAGPPAGATATHTAASPSASPLTTRMLTH